MADTTKLAHAVFFTLKDKSPEKQQRLIEACHKYLEPQPGVLVFVAGTRDGELAREVNDRNFDVTLMILFESRAAHDLPQSSPQCPLMAISGLFPDW